MVVFSIGLGLNLLRPECIPKVLERNKNQANSRLLNDVVGKLQCSAASGLLFLRISLILHLVDFILLAFPEARHTLLYRTAKCEVQIFVKLGHLHDSSVISNASSHAHTNEHTTLDKMHAVHKVYLNVYMISTMQTPWLP